MTNYGHVTRKPHVHTEIKHMHTGSYKNCYPKNNVKIYQLVKHVTFHVRGHNLE